MTGMLGTVTQLAEARAFKHAVAQALCHIGGTEVIHLGLVGVLHALTWHVLHAVGGWCLGGWEEEATTTDLL